MIWKPEGDVCKHCGVGIVQVPYGAGLRWEHYSTINGVKYPAGPSCRSQYRAEPKEE